MADAKQTSPQGSDGASSVQTPPTPPDSPRMMLAAPPLSPDSDLERQIFHSYPPAVGSPGVDAGYAGGASVSPTRSRDPLLLRDRMLSDEAMSSLRARGRKGKEARKFYETQNEHITAMLKTLDEDAQEGRDAANSNQFRVKVAVNASFAVNCCLAILQLYAAASSLSLSFFATALDAVFDPVANLTLNFLHKRSARVDIHKYPAGGSRFETIGNIVYSAVMGCASVVLVVESIQALVRGKTDDNHFHIAATVAVSVSFALKLVLFLYCWALRNVDSQVRVLWEDHRNDLFINGFGIFSNAAGAKITWWIDPAGAMAISLALIILWGTTILREFKLLAGIGAPNSFLQKVVYKAMMFSDDILQIDSIKAYHSGPSYIVELDIVMDAQTPLHKAHDVAQLLQDKIEALKDVERAYIHIDHESSHRPEHQKMK